MISFSFIFCALISNLKKAHSKFSTATPHLFKFAPSGILDFSQKQSGTHFGIVAGAVMLALGNVELVAEVVESVAGEVIVVACGTESAVVVHVGSGEAVQLQ